MRVCVVSFKDCWQDASGRWCSYGGFPLQMEALASLFDEMTLVISRVAARDGGIPLPPHATVVGLPLPATSDLPRKIGIAIRSPYYLARIGAAVRAADAVHLPLPGDIPLLGLLVGVLCDKRVLARYGSSWEPTAQTTLMNRFTKGCMRYFAGGRRVMLATGEGAGDAARGVPWIFSTALWQRELERITPDLARGLAPVPRLVYIGRLSPEKGVHILLRALGLLCRRRAAPCALTLIGDGPQRQQLEALAAAEGCRDLVSFAGQLDREALGSYLLQADVCVQPSLTEGFSKAWLDAMAYGLPVLSSNVGAARFVIGESAQRGWLVPPGDPDALALALERVLDPDADWPAMRRRCRHYAEQRTLEAWAGRLADFCRLPWNVSIVDGKLRA